MRAGSPATSFMYPIVFRHESSLFVFATVIYRYLNRLSSNNLIRFPTERQTLVAFFLTMLSTVFYQSPRRTALSAVLHFFRCIIGKWWNTYLW